MAGYTRQDTANNISNGSVIDADDLDAEFNALEAAYNASTGHAHDGSSGSGAAITKVGPAQDLVVSTTAVMPKTTNTLDLGSAAVQYKSAWFDGTVDTDALVVSANATVGGTFGVTGVLTATGGVVGSVTGTVTGQVTDVSNHDTGDITEGSNLYFTTTRARASISAIGNLGYNSSTGVLSFTQGNTDTVAEGSTNLYYTTARATAAAKAAISVTDVGGDGSLTYSAGLITYTGPSAAESRAHFSAGTGVTYSGGQFSIGQAVGTADNVTFNNTTVDGNLIVNGTTTTVNSNDVNIGDATLTLNSDETGTPSQDAGITIERGTATNKSLHWDESEDEWTVFGERFKAGTFEGNLTGNVTGNVTGDLTGNVAGNTSTATALQTSRTIALTGDVTGSVAFDGSANATITATVQDDSHNHTLSNIDGITASVSELNKMDGVTSTTTELNYVDGVTSNIQTQLNSKASTVTQGTSVWEAGTGTTEGVVSPAKVKAAITSNTTVPIGYNQTWRKDTSRAAQTWYHNNSESGIMVQAYYNQGASVYVGPSTSTFVEIRQNDIDGDLDNPSYVIIPAGHYWKVSHVDHTGGSVYQNILD